MQRLPVRSCPLFLLFRAFLITILVLVTAGFGVLTLRSYGFWSNFASAAKAAPRASVSSGTPGLMSFDVPGAGTTAIEGTLPSSINASGVIAGTAIYTGNVSHGFVRAVDGTITSFAAPDAGTGNNQGTFAVNINTGGAIAGMYADARNTYHGFVRAADGTITEFDVPAAGTSGHRGTIAMSINDSGVVAGTYVTGSVDTTSVRHGFVRATNSTITSFDAPHAGAQDKQGTVGVSINAKGTITGFYIDGTYVAHGFVRAVDGTITEFDPPGTGTGNQATKGLQMGTIPISIDAAGDVVGIYADTSNVRHAFMRASNGIYTSFDGPGAAAGGTSLVSFFPGTTATHIAPGGSLISGGYLDASGVLHGFERAADGAISTVDGPNVGMGTGGTSINDAGDLTGVYMDTNNVLHGFLLPSSAPSAATPTFSVAAGTYTTTQSVTISDTTIGTTICYTTDKSTPTATTPGTCSNGTTLTNGASVSVSTSETLQAIATASGYSNSAVATAAYVIGDFSLPAAPSSFSATPGTPATSPLTITPVGGFTGTITFTCTVPAAMLEASCSASSVQITGSTPVTSTLTVNTTAPHRVSAALRASPWTTTSYGMVFAAMVLATGADKRGWRIRLLLALLLTLTLFGLVSCGNSGSGSSTKTDPGTPAGTYNLTVAATSGSASHSMSIPVTVQ